MFSAVTIKFGHICVGSCPSSSCILCKYSNKPKCPSGSHFAPQQFEESQLTTSCDMLPHIEIEARSEHHEHVRVEVSVVSGKRYKSTCPVPWRGSDSPKDRDMRLACQQLHIAKYDKESKGWIQEPEKSMLVGGPEWESPAGKAVFRDIELHPGFQIFELEGFAIQYNGRQTPWRLMVRVCLLDADAFGHPGQYQELAVEVSEPFQVTTKRSKDTRLPNIPLLDGPVKQLEGVGREIFKRLDQLDVYLDSWNDNPSNVRAHGRVTIRPEAPVKIDTVRLFKELKEHAERSKWPEQVMTDLRLNKTSTLQHLSKAVQEDDSRRMFQEDAQSEFGLLYTAQHGHIVGEGDQRMAYMHPHALLRFAAQGTVYSLEVQEASADQAEFMKRLAGQAFANWKKLGHVNHPGWSILSQDAYEAIVPRNAEQFAELQTTCVSGHHEAMLSMGNNSEGEQDVHMAPVACDPPVGSPCSTCTPESFVMSGDEAPRMSLPATPVPSSSHAQADHGSDIRLPVALPVANEQLDMAAPQQANMVTPLPESQLALSSRLNASEAATAADELDPDRSYLLPDMNDAVFPSGGVSDIELLYELLRDEESRAATRSDLRSEANSLGLQLINQSPTFPAVLPSTAHPATDQEAGAEFTSTPHIHPGVSSEVFQAVQDPGSKPALGTPHASPLAPLYEAWRQGPADSCDGPSHQGASLQQAMPPTNMDVGSFTEPHEIPNLENLHAGMPSTDEAQLADSAQQSAPVHRHASAKSNSPLSDDHMHPGSRSRKRNRKEMSHNKMLCLVCYLVFGLFGLLSDSPPTWFPSYSSGQAGLAHSFKAKQEPRMTITISPEVQQHDQHQQAMWEEHWGPMLLDKQAARKLKTMYSKFEGRRSPAVRGLLVPGFTATEQRLNLHGLGLLLDHIRMRLTLGKLAMESPETRYNSTDMKVIKWLADPDNNLRQPLFWCQALYLLHSSSHLTGFCISIDCVLTHQQGLQVLPCCLHAFVCIAMNLQISLTTFSAQSLHFYQVVSKPKQMQIPLGWSPQYGPSRPAADVPVATGQQLQGWHMYALSVSMCCTP